MLYSEIFRLLAYFLLGFSLVLLPPLSLSVYYEYYSDPAMHPQPFMTIYFVETIVIIILLALSCMVLGRHAKGSLFRREGVAAVVIIWFLTPAISSLPFLLSGTLTDPFQVYFEMTSGFTTTGASILYPKKFDPVTGEEIPIRITIPDVQSTTYIFYGTVEPVRDSATDKIIYEGIEAVSPELLFWRSLTQWVGGGGIVVLFVAVLPALGVGGKMLFQTEVSGPIKDTLTPRIKETAIQLWKIYLGLTIAQIVLLLYTNSNLSLFDAVTTTFGTISTGGFSVKNESIAAYDNAWTEGITTIFMFLGGVNFALYYYLVKAKIYRLYEEEFLLYVFIVIAVCGLSTWSLMGTTQEPLSGYSQETYSFTEALRHGSFQAISALTSTGFIIANYDLWPTAIQVILLIAMFLGGMSGSTAGGIKTIRHYILFRLAKYKTESVFQPQAVRIFKIGNKEIDVSSATMVMAFFIIVISFSAFSTLVFVYDGMDSQSALGLTTCTLNNAGMGFRANGAVGTFAYLSDFSLAYSSFLMILGRLEYFSVLAFFIPAFWRQNS